MIGKIFLGEFFILVKHAERACYMLKENGDALQRCKIIKSKK